MSKIYENGIIREMTTEEQIQYDLDNPVKTNEEIAAEKALAEKQSEIQRLIDGGEFALLDELRRQNLSASAANETMVALLEYLAEAFPEQFGI